MKKNFTETLFYFYLYLFWCFHSQVREWETPTLLGPLERANPSHLEHQLVDKVQKTINRDCHTPSSESFRL
jgi:hypothetical protein